MRRSIAIAATLLAVAAGVVVRLTFVEADHTSVASRENGPIVVAASGLEGRTPQYESLFLVGPEGSDLSRITGRVGLGQPDWSPDGTAIAFVGPGPGRTGDIYVAAADGSHVRRLTATRSEEGMPAWSPDGRRIAFTREGALWVMEADGSGQTRLIETGGGEYQSSPSWSPDGTKIAFVRPFDFGIFEVCPRNTGTGVFVADADGYDVHRISIDGCRHRISWSPSGEYIAIIGDRGRIQLLDPGGRTIKSFGQPSLPPDHIGFGIAGPVWSPDGRLLAFSLQANIWTLEVDSGRWRQLTRNTGFAITDLDWGPTPSAKEPAAA